MKYKKAYLREIKRARGGVSWCGVLTYKDKNGQWKQTSKIFDHEEVNTERKAKSALETWRNEMERAAETEAEESQRLPQNRGVKASKVTVSEYVNKCIDDMEASGEVERSTVSDYRHTTRYLKQGSHPIANMKLAELARTDVKDWEAGLLKRGGTDKAGLSPVTIGKAHRLLKQCVHIALGDEVLQRDPIINVHPPKRAYSHPNALDVTGRERVRALLENMQPTPLKTGIALAMYAGMREGEICALRWDDVDFTNNKIHIERAIGRATGTGTYIKDPKNGGSRRIINPPEQAMDILKERYTQMKQECADEGVLFHDGKGFYVLGDIRGQYFSPDILGRDWAALAKSYDITGTTSKRVTFHDLRHTFATVAVAEGVDIKTVSDEMGHANAAMTLNTYSDATAESKERAAKTLTEAFDRTAPKADVIAFDKTGTTGE